MKTKHLIKIFTLSLFLTALSCEEDIIIDNFEEVQLESKWLDAKRKTSSISKISSKDIPEIVSYLQSMTSKGYDPNTTKTHQPIIDFEHGVSLTDSLGRTNYTFSMFVPEKKYKGPRLYSLIVGVDAEGRMSNPMVLRLTPKKGHEKKWIEDDFDFSKFKGKVSLHKYTDFFNENPFSRTTDYCPPEYDQYGDPIECVADEVDGGGTGGSGGSYAPAGGATGGCTYSMYWNYCGGSNDNISHPGGPPPICGGDGSGAGWVLETSCPNYTDITIFHKSSGAKSDCPNCETGPSGDVVMYSYDRSVAKLDYYMRAYFDQYLTPSELTWLNIHPDMAYNINQPLKTGGFTTRNLAIAYAKLKTYMHPGNTEYANRLSNLITGKAVSAFPYIKYPADKATLYRNQYPKLTEYLEKQLPKVANINKIVDALNNFTQISKETIKQDLQWESGPILEIVQLDNYNPDTDSDTAGYFDKEKPDKVLLDIDYVNQMENGTLIENDNDAAIFFIGTTILHEYVHYGDYSNGFDYPGEEGRKFEISVYGENVHPDRARIVLNRIN